MRIGEKRYSKVFNAGLVILMVAMSVIFLSPFKLSTSQIGNGKTTIQESMDITLQANKSDFIENNGFVRGSIFAPGAPMIPIISKEIKLPVSAVLKSVKIDYKIMNFEALNKDYLKFKHAPFTTTDGVHFYGNNWRFPDKPVNLVSTGGYRDAYKFVKIVYYPLIYNSGSYLFCSKVHLTIKFNEDSQLLPKKIKSTDSVGYAIVTTNNIRDGSSNLSKYVQYLETIGYNVYIVTEDDYGTATGQQRAINIRTWLKNNYINDNIKYVLLIGNPDPDDPSDSSDSYGDVPMMMTWPRAYGYDESPTDYFYADLTGDWDLDGDGYYGEWVNDTGSGGVDYVADVYVGRIPVYDNDYSTLDYILGRLMQGGSLPSKILLPMAISNYQNENNGGSSKTDGQKLPYYVGKEISGYTIMAMYEGKGLDPVDSSAAYYTYDIDEYNFTQEWNKGYGYVLWWSHGGHTGAYRKVWTSDDGDNIPESGEMSWYSFINTYHTLRNLNPENTIVFQVSCLNGYPEDKYNLGYNLLKKALATISASRVSWYIVGMWGPPDLEFYADNANIGYSTLTEMIKNSTSIGEALYRAKAKLSSYLDSDFYMNLMDFNLYGPPELKKVRETLIRNVYDLQNMSKDLNGHYILANDIDATVTKTWNGGAGFMPIGNESAPFNGTFDGRGHKIINLWINRSSTDYVGLFGFVTSNAVIENVSLINVSVRGNNYTGGLVGENAGTVSNSYITGNASGSKYVGGLVGENYGTVSNSYSTGSVRGNNYTGGLVGKNGGTVNNSYATGNVSGSSDVGGLVGENGGTVTASFWDVNTSGIGQSDGGTGLTTAEMKNKTTFLNAGWDFTNIWDIVDGQTYPFFKWQKPSKPSSPLYLHATAGDGYVNLTWTNPSFDGASPITNYTIYRNGTKIAEVPATQLWYNDTDVVNGVTYTYYVTAVNSAGESPRSNEVQATPGGTIPEITPGAIIIVALLSLMTALRKRKN